MPLLALFLTAIVCGLCPQGRRVRAAHTILRLPARARHAEALEATHQAARALPP